MGNAECIGHNGGLDGICAGRGFPEFIAPNTEHVTYSFNYTRDCEIGFSNGLVGAVSAHGFTLEPQVNERRAPKWYVVKEYAPSPAQLRLHASGRAFVHCPPDLGTPRGVPTAGVCALRICTRGRPVFESIHTDHFTHTAHVVTSGLFFVLGVAASAQGLVLCPRLVAVLESGDEVPLVDDRLGPLRPQSYYVDFAVLDEGGRNVQVDIIFRGAEGEGAAEGGMRTLRTCLQDYIALNSQCSPASVCLGSTDLAPLLPGAGVHLQHLVISEERFEEPVPRPEPFDVWREGAHQGMRAGAGRLLYEGEDAYEAVRAATGGGPGGDGAEGALAHPQLRPPPARAPSGQDEGLESAGRGFRRCGAYRESLAESCTQDFWHHVCYDEEAEPERTANPNCPEDATRLRGEFWLSKQAVDKKQVYFHCSSTLAQATTMCIAFRFSCPLDYLQLIERAGGSGGARREAVGLLRDGHIPANGVVLGVEHDPRHRGLLRMFVEHRNEIKDDMVLCECRGADLGHAVLHQEVYDSGTVIAYRVTVLHRDGARQSAVLQANAEEFEDAADSARAGSQYRMVEEPSPRFPISPCQVSQSLSPANRVFLYTATSHEPPDERWADVEAGEGVDERLSAEGMRTPVGFHPTDCSHMSDATAEDWQSVCGGYSDGESDAAHHHAGDPHRGRLGCSHSAEQLLPVRWRRPLIESAVLLSRMEEAPFKCFPASLS